MPETGEEPAPPTPEIPGEEPAPPTPEIPGEEPDLEICNDPNTMDSELPGLGTTDDPFVLCLPAHLALLGHFMYSSSSFNYVMGQNIDLKNQDVSPIANFSGILNGRGKKIMNPTIHVITGNAALFLTLRVGGAVKNLGIEMADVEGRDYVGSLVAINFGRIKDCYATGSVFSSFLSSTPNPSSNSSTSYSGGLVGYNGGTITSSYATGTVSASINSSSILSTSYSGGLVGYNSGTIISSYATGAVFSSSSSASSVSLLSISSNSGGLVGHNNRGAIISSYATGDVSSSASSASASILTSNSSSGGLVGSNGGTITSSYATGNVFALSLDSGVRSSSWAGGLVGSNAGSSGMELSLQVTQQEVFLPPPPPLLALLPIVVPF